ncbi:hypothetical protein Z043_100346 [Scleropages formosus]|uniref:Uncharacterized protein n=1 Tax=Scleropages formosus TaxID=113540 RepID=A0A0P7W0W5_SCLFO|nr:hypothetical protein Z043_100346 [Scleropages formosus]
MGGSWRAGAQCAGLRGNTQDRTPVHHKAPQAGPRPATQQALAKPAAPLHPLLWRNRFGNPGSDTIRSLARSASLECGGRRDYPQCRLLRRALCASHEQRRDTRGAEADGARRALSLLHQRVAPRQSFSLSHSAFLCLVRLETAIAGSGKRPRHRAGLERRSARLLSSRAASCSRGG